KDSLVREIIAVAPSLRRGRENSEQLAGELVRGKEKTLPMATACERGKEARRSEEEEGNRGEGGVRRRDSAAGEFGGVSEGFGSLYGGGKDSESIGVKMGSFGVKNGVSKVVGGVAGFWGLVAGGELELAGEEGPNRNFQKFSNQSVILKR
ncbi:hypothetical protein LINGRAHAP2_LOCUS4684, partial [Linum grandiflorum]